LLTFLLYGKIDIEREANMKKLSIILLIGIFVFTLTGCEKTEKTDKTSTNDDGGSKTVETAKKDLTYFKTEVKSIVPNSNETTVYYTMVGATNGAKIYSDENNNFRIEIYQFDKTSDKYKTAEKDQQLCISADYCFGATVKNGYAMLIDDNFPKKVQVISLFNELK
jgi:uncharacterized lipoprotein YehR (DUF1307 family)